MVILVTGSTGMFSEYVVIKAKTYGSVIKTSRKKSDYNCELSHEGSVKKMMSEINPDVVIHAAGLTSIEECENDFISANMSNHKSTANIVKYIKHSTKLVVISTDQVYPDKPGLHSEDNTSPVNNYGITKLAGELSTNFHDNTLILRVNIFGPSLTNGRFSIDDFIINSIKKKKDIVLFSDVFFSPLHMSTLSSLIFKMIDKDLTGIFNIGCREGMSKADFGFAVIKHMGLSTNTVKVGISDSFVKRVKRPHDMRMDVSRIERVLGIRMPTLLQEIEKL